MSGFDWFMIIIAVVAVIGLADHLAGGDTVPSHPMRGPKDDSAEP